MVRFWFRTLGAAVALLLALVLWILGWLLGTADGARFLLEKASALGGVPLEIAEVEGRLLDELSLKGLALRWPGGELEAGQLWLAWEPRSLLSRHLEVSGLSLSDARIRLEQGEGRDAAADPVQLAWPSASFLPSLWTAGIGPVDVSNLRIEPAGAQPFEIRSLHTQLAWDGQRLDAQPLRLDSSLGEGSGSLSLALEVPALKAELDLRPRLPGVPLQSLELDLDLSSASPKELPSGSWRLRARGGEEPLRGEAAGKLRLEATRLFLSVDALSQPFFKGELQAGATLNLQDAATPWELHLKLRELDVSPLGAPETSVSGSLELRGDWERYRGAFSLANRGADWQRLELRSDLEGDLQSLALKDLSGSYEKMPLEGALKLDWAQGFELGGELRLSDISVPGDVFGQGLALAVQGELRAGGEEGLEAHSRIRIFGPRKPGSGERAQLGRGELRYARQMLHIESFEFEYAGARLRAAGRYPGALSLNLALEDLSRLLPEAAGSLSLQAELDVSGEPRGSLRLRADNLVFEQWKVAQLGLDAEGGLSRHRLGARLSEAGETLRLELAGGWNPESRRWSGELERLEGDGPVLGRWQLATSAALSLTEAALHLGKLELLGESGWKLQLAGGLQYQPPAGGFSLAWENFDPGYLGVWKEGLRIQGNSSGSGRILWRQDQGMELSATADFAGLLSLDGQDLEFETLEASARWDAGGLGAELSSSLGDGSLWKLELRGPGSPEAGLPSALRLALEFERLDISTLDPWLPEPLLIRGTLSGKGALSLEGDRLYSEGIAWLDISQLHWRQQSREFAPRVRRSRVFWLWEEQGLALQADLELAEAGRVQGRVLLPLAARLPLVWSGEAPLSGEVHARVSEMGIFASFVPGVIQETRGKLDVDLRLAGTVASPRLFGKVRLFEATAYIPLAGISLSRIAFEAEFNQERMELKSLLLRSGKGYLKGSGSLDWTAGGLKSYRLDLEAEQFELLRLPDIHAVAQAKLGAQGTADLLRIRGQVLLQEFLLLQSKGPSLQQPSSDQIILDSEQEAEARGLPFALDARVQVKLGDRVLIKAYGVDAKLGGEVEIIAQSLDDIRAEGAIHVVKGIYAGHGVRLDIERGNLLFNGGPVERPNLDVLATRTAGSVKAGIAVAGSPRQPRVSLYSDPAMAETDILSYMVLGRPLDPKGGGEASLLMLAAGGLLSRGESVVLQDRLQRTLGIDVIDIHAGDGDVADSVVTIGKYLRPNLYISLGHSLFTRTNEFKLRYDFAPKWELESSMGVQSGVDLYYRIEFR